MSEERPTLDEAGRHSELEQPGPMEEQWYVKFFYYFLILAQFVPVSLYVSMSTVKYFQALFMNWDLGMYHEEVRCVRGGEPV